MHVDISLIVYCLFTIIAILIIVIIWLVLMQFRLSRLLRGKNAQTLEDSITTILKELKDQQTFIKDMEQYLTTVERRVKKSVQSVETIRFNPFAGTGSGGNNSFSTVFLTEKGDGITLTSMYSRDRISMFAKQIKNFTSEYELTLEEKEAIEKAKNNLTT